MNCQTGCTLPKRKDHCYRPSHPLRRHDVSYLRRAIPKRYVRNRKNQVKIPKVVLDPTQMPANALLIHDNMFVDIN